MINFNLSISQFCDLICVLRNHPGHIHSTFFVNLFFEWKKLIGHKIKAKKNVQNKCYYIIYENQNEICYACNAKCLIRFAWYLYSITYPKIHYTKLLLLKKIINKSICICTRTQFKPLWRTSRFVAPLSIWQVEAGQFLERSELLIIAYILSHTYIWMYYDCNWLIRSRTCILDVYYSFLDLIKENNVACSQFYISTLWDYNNLSNLRGFPCKIWIWS